MASMNGKGLSPLFQGQDDADSLFTVPPTPCDLAFGHRPRFGRPAFRFFPRRLFFMSSSTLAADKPTEQLDSAVIRFCGDSGDGMQVVGGQLTNTSAAFGNDVSTFPDFPAEIRAPAGTLAGVSGFQLHFSSKDIYTPGDQVDALVVMNPAALKTNIADLKRGGILIVNIDEFDTSNFDKAGYDSNPLDDPAL